MKPSLPWLTTRREALKHISAGALLEQRHLTRHGEGLEHEPDRRARAILRRVHGDQNDDGILRFADVELDDNAHEVRRAGHAVQLTATEFNVLRFFMLNPRQVLSKTQILDHVWHYDFGGDGNVVETYVSYLRKKLEVAGPPVIHTVRLVGYALREPVPA